MQILAIATVAVLVVVAAYPSLGAEISQLECQRYYETLNKAIATQKECELPAFSDCCQVSGICYCSS